MSHVIVQFGNLSMGSRRGEDFMKKWRRILAGVAAGVLLVCGTVQGAEPASGAQVLKFDRPADVSKMPATFRTAQSPFKRSADDAYPSRIGLDELRISGSSVFSKNEFKQLLDVLPADRKDIVILDLRNESHGYINGHAVSWYSRYKTFNQGLSSEGVMKREQALLKAAKTAGTVEIAVQAKDKSISFSAPIKVDSIMTEKQYVESMGALYYRIPIMDYSAPTAANIDQFIEFYKRLPKTAWIHAHCEAGVGRTLMALAMVDMIHNARVLSYDQIMDRQVLLGGEDVRKSAATATDPYKKVNYPKRAEFTRYFYEYAKAHPQLDISWSDWCRVKQGLVDY